MTRTSKALKRLGVAGLAVATIGAGVPAFFATAAQAATGPQLVADDCTVPSTGNTTTTQANSAPAGQPSNATGAGSGCTTQAQINTVKTLTFTYTEDGAPVAGRDIDFTLLENGVVPGTPTANFPNNQPSGTSSQPNSANQAGQLATCTTNAQGKCSVNVTDSQPETVTVTGKERSTGTTANEIVDFRSNSVAARRLDQTGRVVVEPEDSGSNRTDDPNVPTPGRPVQLTYQVTDLNGDGSAQPSDTQCTTGTNNNQATCTGSPVANQLVTVRVNQAAFFTPNCTPRDQSGTNAPQRGGNAMPPAGATPGTASTGTLAAPDYRGCSFASAPVNDAVVGPLTSLGNTITVRTDFEGKFTVTVAEGRDIGFDDDGDVTVALTVTEQGSTTALTPRTAGGTDTAAPALVFTTKERALTGLSTDIVFVDGSTAATSTTLNVPNNQSRTFVVYLRDQYGNLAQATNPGTANSNDNATITKTGVGTLFRCTGAAGGSTSTSDCTGADSSGSSADPQNDGTTTQTYQVTGSYTNRALQERFQSTANSYPGTNGSPSVGCQIFGTNCPAPSPVESGTQTLTATWIAPITEFVVDTSTGAVPFGTVTGPPAGPTGVSGGFDQNETDNVLTRVVKLNYYTQQATDITFDRTPKADPVAPGTVVTVSARVLDQFGNPVQGQPVQFFRTGSTNNCTSTTQNGTGNGGATTTGPDGRAGFSFSCDASNQTVTIVVQDKNGNELKRGTQNVTFANAQQPQSPAATNTASTSPSASASQSTSPSASASASQSTSPAPSCTPAQQNLRIKYLVTQGKVGNGQVGPVANATQLVTVQVDGATPGGTIVLEAYQQNHFGTATFANSGNLRTAVADSAGVAKIDVRFSSNARTRARMQGCTFSTTSNNNSGYSQGSGANGNVLYVKTVLTFTVTRVNVTTLRISGDSLPARPGGLIVNIDCKDAKCRAGVNQNGNNPNGILLQPRANPTNGEFGPVEYTFKTFKAGERVTLYATTGDPDTGKGDAQNIAGRSNDRSVVFVR
jgi:hypothetical protein